MNLSPAKQSGAGGNQRAAPIGGSRTRTLPQMVLDTAARFDGSALQFPCHGRTVSMSNPALGQDE